MAVKKVTKTKEKKVDTKDLLFKNIGGFLADDMQSDIIRIKQKGKSEFLLITIGDKDYTISITEKKDNVDYDGDDVVDTYEPTDSNEENIEDTESNQTE